MARAGGVTHRLGEHSVIDQRGEVARRVETSAAMTRRDVTVPA
jgi:hypothetical protein